MDTLLLVGLVVGTAALLSWPLGRYLHWAMDPPGRPGALFERIAGQPARTPQDWKHYALALLGFNGVMFAFGYLLLALQARLPLNPDAHGALEASLLFNTAASFATNTNLQHYAGEASMSHLSQLGALMWLQFLSAASGIAALTAVSRGLAGRETLGNFWVDVQRASVLVLLPLAVVAALLFVAGGVPMTLGGAVQAHTLEGPAQTIARGPVAAFVAIKQLGTNGGGFFGPNATHPFENPGFWTDVLSMICILLIPMACVWLFGRIVGRRRHAALLFAVMLALLLGQAAAAIRFESEPTPAFAALAAIEPVDGNFEGKELRFGSPQGSGPLWSVLTTVTSNGSVGAMHDSLNPLAGLVPMIGMWLNAGFGGVGVGMINMIVYVVLAVFVAGMMIGRTPEYLNRRIEPGEMRLAVLTAITHGVFVLTGTALFAVTPWGRDTLSQPGPHGFSQILYEFSSASANNGSGFEGLGDNTVAWNLATGLVMLFSRYLPIVLPLAMAGALSRKRRTADSAGTLCVHDATFAVMLLATILLLGALSFFPAAALGPVAEHRMFVD